MPFIIVHETRDKDGNVLQTSYYKGYKMLDNKASDGPMFGYDKEHAQVFANLTNADNVIGGDTRMQGCVVRAV